MMTGFIWLIGICVATLVAGVIAGILTDWHDAYQDKQSIDLQKELLHTAWRKLDVERTKFNAQQALHHQAMHTLNNLLDQGVNQQRKRCERERCKLNHPSTRH